MCHKLSMSLFYHWLRNSNREVRVATKCTQIVITGWQQSVERNIRQFLGTTNARSYVTSSTNSSRRRPLWACLLDRNDVGLFKSDMMITMQVTIINHTQWQRQKMLVTGAKQGQAKKYTGASTFSAYTLYCLDLISSDCKLLKRAHFFGRSWHVKVTLLIYRAGGANSFSN